MVFDSGLRGVLGLDVGKQALSVDFPVSESDIPLNLDCTASAKEALEQ